MKSHLGRVAVVVAVALGGRLCNGYDSVSVGQLVTQKRGFVCLDDECVIYKKQEGSASDGQPLVGGPNQCWWLNRMTSVGVVVKVESEHVVVQFPSTADWFPVTTDTDLEKHNLIWDFWGEKEEFTKRGQMEVAFRKSDCGKLLTGVNEAGAPKVPAQVRLPKQCISWTLPRFGDEVVRGPDWNKGSADLQPGMKGRIIRLEGESDPRSDDGYVTVQWEATKRRGRYRWDCRRKFDVVPVARPVPVPPLPTAGTVPGASDATSPDGGAGVPVSAPPAGGPAESSAGAPPG